MLEFIRHVVVNRAAALKPCFIALTFIVRFILVRRVIPLRDELLILIPAIFVFAVVSSKTGFSHHLRYVLPCIPFVFIWISQLWYSASSIPPQAKRSLGVVPILATLLLCYTTFSSLYYSLHNLAYFNEVAGGPEGGPKHLINSNIDWGQDLLHLEAWIKENGEGKRVYLAYDNYVNPFVFDIDGIEPWPMKRASKLDVTKTAAQSPEIPDGYFAISINQLYEFPWPLRDRTNKFYYLDLSPLKNLRAIKPVAIAGYSIYIYSADQIRNAYYLPTN